MLEDPDNMLTDCAANRIQAELHAAGGTGQHRSVLKPRGRDHTATDASVTANEHISGTSTKILKQPLLLSSTTEGPAQTNIPSPRAQRTTSKPRQSDVLVRHIGFDCVGSTHVKVQGFGLRVRGQSLLCVMYVAYGERYIHSQSFVILALCTPLSTPSCPPIYRGHQFFSAPKNRCRIWVPE